LRQKELLDAKAHLEASLEHFKQVNKELVQKLKAMSSKEKSDEQATEAAQSERLTLDHFKQEIRKRDELIK